jgi:hypothetical protein
MTTRLVVKCTSQSLRYPDGWTRPGPARATHVPRATLAACVHSNLGFTNPTPPGRPAWYYCQGRHTATKPAPSRCSHCIHAQVRLPVYLWRVCLAFFQSGSIRSILICSIPILDLPYLDRPVHQPRPSCPPKSLALSQASQTAVRPLRYPRVRAWVLGATQPDQHPSGWPPASTSTAPGLAPLLLHCRR